MNRREVKISDPKTVDRLVYQEVGRFGDVQAHRVPVFKVLVTVFVTKGDGRQFVASLQKVFVDQIVEHSLFMAFDLEFTVLFFKHLIMGMVVCGQDSVFWTRDKFLAGCIG